MQPAGSSIARWSWCDVLGKTRSVHFIGIGGIGMSGIAELLASLGYVVTGSDERRSPVTERPATPGARVMYGHAAQQVGGAVDVAAQAAARSTNPGRADAGR